MKKVVILLFFTIALFLFCESSLFAQNEIKNENHIYKINGFIYILKSEREALRQMSHDLLMLQEKEVGESFALKPLPPVLLERIKPILGFIRNNSLNITQETLLIENVVLYEEYLLSLCPFVEKGWKKKVYQKKIIQLEVSSKTINDSLSRIKRKAKRKMSIFESLNKIAELQKITLNKLFVVDNIAHDVLIEYKVEEILVTLQYIIETFKEDINNL